MQRGCKETSGVKDGTVQTRMSAEGNACPCLSMNILEVHAAASVTEFPEPSRGDPGD